MKLKEPNSTIRILLICIALLMPVGAMAGEAASMTVTSNTSDILPSWNDCQAKTAILDYVAAVTNDSSPSYVPPEERIAVFDMDGTLCCEQPSPFMLLFMQDRVRDLAPMHPEWNSEEPFVSILSGEILTESNYSIQEIFKVYAATSTNMTVDEYSALVRSWINSIHPRFGRPYSECVYQPMLDLLDYLRSNDFKNYIVTGSGVDFVRAFSESTYGIPPEQVIGSSWEYKFVESNDTSSISMLPNIWNYDNGPTKPTSIQLFIGRRPILAYGNSDGDIEMLEFATDGNPEAIGLLNNHNDAAREYIYDEGALNSSEMAPQSGWHLVSMKDDWKWIFPFEMNRA
ncbi:MAG TPA: HAD family hydrolase [Methanotrichaceae archaeon]|nr:HAD family hydrolase [Methanotrichaceae archaeon]HQJ27804.1 HAD family hydrolase [Methanotrichaceae archaeon]